MTYRNLATLALGIVGLAAAMVALASFANESRDIGDVLHRAQSQSEARHFEELLDTLGVKPASLKFSPAAVSAPENKPAPTSTAIKRHSTQSA